MKKLLITAAILLIAISGFAQDKTPRLDFPLNGFSILPLEGSADSVAYQVLSLYLPASEGFSPNVSVQVQPHDGTMEEYLEISKDQFKALQWTLLADSTLSPTVITFEYTGSVRGVVLHFYAKAESREGKVYLTTGAATEGQWPKLSPRIKKCVNSFRFEK